jgi:hypothetical protein
VLQAKDVDRNATLVLWPRTFSMSPVGLEIIRQNEGEAAECLLRYSFITS